MLASCCRFTVFLHAFFLKGWSTGDETNWANCCPSTGQSVFSDPFTFFSPHCILFHAQYSVMTK